MFPDLIEGLIFQPDSDVGRPPAGVEERWIPTGDGVRLHAWYARGGRDAPSLVWSHGNGGNIAGRVEVQIALARRGLNVLAYDYRGYGRSSGSPSEEGVYRDAAAAYDSERQTGVPAQSILAFGESLGGAVSVALARNRPCAGLVLVSTFTNIRSVARNHFGPLAILAGNRFDSAEGVRGLRVPIFLAHGDQDEIVPYDLGKQLFAAANQPKEFVTVRGAHHNDVFAAPELLDAIAAFALRVTGRGGTAGGSARGRLAGR